jgi:hypothetical protein
MAAIRPWWDLFPKTPTEAIKATIETPTVATGGVGGIGATVFKHITKTTGTRLLPLGLAAGGGFLAASLFGGGGKQEIKPEQKTTVTPKQEAEQRLKQAQEQYIRDLIARFKARLDVRVTPEVTVQPDIIPKYDIRDISGSVDIGGVTHITRTYTHTVSGIDQLALGQIAEALQRPLQIPSQITVTTPEQKTEATQMNTGILALIAAAAIVIFGIGGKKK